MHTFKLVENSFGIGWGLMNAAKVEIVNFHGRFFFLWAVFCGFNLQSEYSDVHFQGLYVVAVECIMLPNDIWFSCWSYQMYY